MAALQTLKVIRELDHPAHQHGEGLVTLTNPLLLQAARHRLHLVDDHGSPVQLHHAQTALNLVQFRETGIDARLVRGIL